MTDISFEDLDIILQNKNGNIIHQIWFGTIPNKLSSIYRYHTLRKFRESWKDKNPDKYYVVWNRNLSRLFLKKHYPEYLNMFNSYQYEIQRCDVIRYFLLYHYGGIYADMDYFCSKSFDKITETYDKDLYFVELPTAKHISNSLIISKPRQQIWKEIFIELAKTSHKPWYFTKHLQVVYSTGSRFINKIYNKYENVYNIGKLPYIYFYPDKKLDFKTIKSDDSIYSYHLENGSWEDTDSHILTFIAKEKIILIATILVLILPLIIRISHK